MLLINQVLIFEPLICEVLQLLLRTAVKVRFKVGLEGKVVQQCCIHDMIFLGRRTTMQGLMFKEMHNK